MFEVGYSVNLPREAAAQVHTVTGEILPSKPPAPVFCRCQVTAAKSTYDLFANGFFKQAALTLPALVEALRTWKPDLILSHFRDWMC